MISIVEFAEKELGVTLSCLQKDLLVILQDDSDFIKYVQKKSHTMVQVLDVFNKWKERMMVAV